MKTFVVVLAALGALHVLGGGQPTAALQASDQLVVLRLRDGALMKSLPVMTSGGFSVSDVVADGRGGWFISGRFTSIAGAGCPTLVRLLPSLQVDPMWCPHVGRAAGIVGLAGQTLYAVGDRGLAAIDVDTGRIRSWYRAVGGERMAVGAGRIFVGADASDAQPAKSSMTTFDVRTGQQLRWSARFNNAKCGRSGTRCYVHFGAVLVRGRVVYVGGTFSRAQGQTHVGFVALDARTARPLAWRADMSREMINTSLVGADAERWHIAAANKRLYVGGEGSLAWVASVNGVRRAGVAALAARTGRLLPWNPPGGGRIFAADRSAVVLGGWDCRSFTRVDTATGRKILWRARPVPANAGSDFVTISGGSVLVHYSEAAAYAC